MTKPIKNVAASIRQRLQNKARQEGQRFDDLLQYYAIERFLYRLSQSSHRETFVLKGALIFLTWGTPFARSTRDVDLLAYTDNSVAHVVKVMQEICQQEVVEDGIHFEVSSVKGETIREQAEYQGVRVKFLGWLENARVNMQIDMGFADVVTPKPKLVTYPVLLELPQPKLRGYPPETVIAEKLQAMIFLGMSNSRMKDFYDLWILSQTHTSSKTTLAEAIRKTFARRNTELPLELPIVFTDEFVNTKQKMWVAYRDKTNLLDAPADIDEIVSRLREWLMPVIRLAQKKK
ncbi:MAG: nucleotidyl transferase AbiEii/AbiGii toxin family protein [Chloroflexi bacterium]|nr:nucleotidyl transferase AbiEii/AbiGii toxin family protein [Chloroflexota bacterium]